MDRPLNHPNQKEFRQNLRNNMTKFENELWIHLRGKSMGAKCRRQVSIGRYIVDFCFLNEKLVIELDGVQHEENNEYDNERTRQLEVLGFKVLRFKNDDIIQSTDSVLDTIFTEVQGRITTPPNLP